MKEQTPEENSACRGVKKNEILKILVDYYMVLTVKGGVIDFGEVEITASYKPRIETTLI